MRKKYNNKSNYFRDWTNKKLKDEAMSYDELIHGEASCYGMSDLKNYSGILQELDSRGITGHTKLSF